MARSCTTIIPVRWLRPRTWQLAFSAVLAIAGGIDSGVGHSHATRKVTASVAIDANGETELTRRLMRSDKSTQHSHSREKQSNLKGSKADEVPMIKQIDASMEQERMELSTLENETKSMWHHEKQLEAVEKDREKNLEELKHAHGPIFNNGAVLAMPDDASWRVKVRRLASREEDDDAGSASSDPKELEPAASRSSEDKELDPAASGSSEDMDDEADTSASSDSTGKEQDASISDPLQEDESTTSVYPKSKDASDSDPSQDESHAALEAERPTRSRKPQVDRTVHNEVDSALMDTIEADRLFDEMSAEAKFIGSHVRKFGKHLKKSEADMDPGS